MQEGLVMGFMGLLKKMISTQVRRLRLRLLRSEPPFPSTAGQRIRGGLSVMLSGMFLWLLHWQQLQSTSKLGSFGHFTGLLREQCSGLYLFSDMIGNHICIYIYIYLCILLTSLFSNAYTDMLCLQCLRFRLNSGHGSFSDNPELNNLVGHVLHSAILVPYHGW